MTIIIPDMVEFVKHVACSMYSLTPNNCLGVCVYVSSQLDWQQQLHIRHCALHFIGKIHMNLHMLTLHEALCLPASSACQQTYCVIT